MGYTFEKYSLGRFSWKDFFASFVFLFGGGLDTGITLYLIQMSTFREGNPIVAEFLAQYGGWGLVSIKLAATVFGFFVVLKFLTDNYQRAIQYSFFVCGIIWMIGGFWNLSLFLFL